MLGLANQSPSVAASELARLRRLPDCFIRYAHDPVCNSAKIRIPQFRDFHAGLRRAGIYRIKNKTSLSSLEGDFLFEPASFAQLKACVPISV